jgi:formylglycine-generating enzyme required for sulfatase activity
MRKAALAGVLALISAAACNSVLDIEEPKTRPSDAGEAGEPPSAAGSSSGGSGGSATVSEGGAGGEGAMTTVMMSGGDGGQAGAPPMLECEPGIEQCADLVPQICDETGHWVQNTDEADGDCEALCSVGKCVECEEGKKQCPICPEGDNNCSPKLPQTCVDGAWEDDDAPCKHFCNAGECVKPPSCTELNEVATTCQEGVSCCTSLLVPGGTFYRDYDKVSEDFTDKNFPATISPFYLDKFEVTVGRLRPFIAAYEAFKLTLVDGAGKSEHIANDTGWRTSNVLPTKADLLLALNDCDGTTWSDSGTPVADKLPVNCLPFNVAYAFCIWDRGRLPTEAEWNFAAAGGGEQRVYPWSDPPTSTEISPDFANYASEDSPSLVAVGSTPAGDGRWGQSDLAGNVSEWTLDYRGDRPATCNDCVNTTASSERVFRGGSFLFFPDALIVAFRSSDSPDLAASHVGFRCARDLD